MAEEGVMGHGWRKHGMMGQGGILGVVRECKVLSADPTRISLHSSSVSQKYNVRIFLSNSANWVLRHMNRLETQHRPPNLFEAAAAVTSSVVRFQRGWKL
jgi:hypothetical protein